MDETAEFSELSNGVRIATRRMRGARGAALGVWLINGVRHESPDEAGYAHLIEHLLFKGSAEHPQLALARRFEAMGGRINAHTGRELSALHGRVPAGDAPALLELFVSMLTRPGFTGHDLELEREVVLQEIAGIEDDPVELIEERGIALAWRDHPLGQPILGRVEVIGRAGTADLRRYLSGRLSGQRLCVVAAGDIDPAQLVERCAALAALPAGEPPAVRPPEFHPGDHGRRGAPGQAHLLWLMPTAGDADARGPAWLMANHALGGGVSSRLFQALREQRGLVYEIYSRVELYSDAGLWLVQTACDPRRAGECRAVVEDALAALAADGPTVEELDTARAQLDAELTLEADDPEAAMERLARDVIYRGRGRTVTEQRRALADVGTADVAAAVRASHARRLHLHWRR
ncbi:MAG TPA: pitrilysin family protein [Acidiferrobacterales bacterium]